MQRSNVFSKEWLILFSTLLVMQVAISFEILDNGGKSKTIFYSEKREWKIFFYSDMHLRVLPEKFHWLRIRET